MRPHVESFKRLYDSKKITLAQVQERLVNGTILQEEFEYITKRP